MAMCSAALNDFVPFPLDARQLRRDFLRGEHSSHFGNESRQRPQPLVPLLAPGTYIFKQPV
jgi:hypothetical protein